MWLINIYWDTSYTLEDKYNNFSSHQYILTVAILIRAMDGFVDPLVRAKWEASG